MTQVREPLGIVDGGPPSLTFSIKSKKGLHVSRSLALLFAAIYIISIVATGLLVYNFVACPHLDLPPPEFSESCNDSSSADVSVKPAAEKDEKIVEFAVEGEKLDVRLPRSILPVKYNIKLLPFIFEGNFTFNGDVSIVVQVTETTNNITLHAADLFIINTEVLTMNEDGVDSSLMIIGQSNDTEKQFHTIHLKNDLKSGEHYRINMSFVGRLNDDLHGFYRSSYKVNNKTR